MTRPEWVNHHGLAALHPDELRADADLIGPGLRRQVMSSFGAILAGPEGAAQAMQRFRAAESAGGLLHQHLVTSDGSPTAESAFFAAAHDLSSTAATEFDVDQVCRLASQNHPEFSSDAMADVRESLKADSKNVVFESSVFAVQKVTDLQELADEGVTMAYDRRKSGAVDAVMLARMIRYAVELAPADRKSGNADQPQERSQAQDGEVDLSPPSWLSTSGWGLLVVLAATTTSSVLSDQPVDSPVIAAGVAVAAGLIRAGSRSPQPAGNGEPAERQLSSEGLAWRAESARLSAERVLRNAETPLRDAEKALREAEQTMRKGSHDQGFPLLRARPDRPPSFGRPSPRSQTT